MPEYNISWTNSKNCTPNYDLTLPLVPYFDCSGVRSYASTVIPPLYYLLSLLGMLGNLCSLWVCLRPSQHWSIGTIGVLNLALCDLTFLASVPPWAVYVAAEYNWEIGRTLCILCNILYFAGLTSSTMFICAISTDRFLAIMFPLESRMIRTPRNAALISLLMWAITVLLIYLSYPNMLYWVRRNGTKYCGAVVMSKYRSAGAAYNLLSYYSVQVCVPLLLVVPSYMKIMARMRQSQKQRSTGGTQGRDKTIWLIAVFIANFLMCWVPGQLLHIIACIIFFTLYECGNTCLVAQVVNLLMEASQLLYCLNACLDPLIFHLQQGLGQQCWRVLGQLTYWARKGRRRQREQEVCDGLPPAKDLSVIRLSVSEQEKDFSK
ncbi:type-1B angiotensin II receptor [Megalops cyprinoides]|uniref:type-1B angiotensin II receptor n=1 Tax=Megalops cyprinoides TaxID=118141 RepID=UPI001863BFB0|nr:type-1B angiotensin II receptor [Megalops cyprinoides]